MNKFNSFLNNIKISVNYLWVILLFIYPVILFTVPLIYNLFIDPGLSVFLGGLSNFISFSLNLTFCGNCDFRIFADPFSGELLGPTGCSVYF